jgi:hypothetical protein
VSAVSSKLDGITPLFAPLLLEGPRGWRIAKDKASRKINAVVALAMASVAAIEGKSVPQIVVKQLLGL